ncbi:DUF6090 family protein [Flagellimonas sp. DF-77]|uniref:DUF6090 family protein n=1 Tax=Flagellimonas algarum TaxID=3230298 RepID=UPI00339186DC
MTNIFKKIRRSSIRGNGFSTYLIYALGEIALVMIGILLALQVNNWNEKRKRSRELDNILQDVKLDLERDTLVAGQIIAFYKISQENSQKIIDGEINADNMAEYPLTRSLVAAYQPFTIQQKGFELLKEFKSASVVKKDTLVTEIAQFYTSYADVLRTSNEFVKEDVFKNLESFRERSWFVDWSQGRLTEDMVAYFTTSKDYKTRVAAHKILAIDNHLNTIKSYQLNAKELLRMIQERLVETP